MVSNPQLHSLLQQFYSKRVCMLTLRKYKLQDRWIRFKNEISERSEHIIASKLKRIDADYEIALQKSKEFASEIKKNKVIIYKIVINIFRIYPLLI